MSDPKIEALTKGFLAAGEPEDQILRLVEENYSTARLIGDGEGGVQAEIRRADGSYATPATAKHLDSYTPKTDEEIRQGMAEWIRLRNAGVVDPSKVKPEIEPEPAPPPPKTAEERTAEHVLQHRAERQAKFNPANSPNLPPADKPWKDLTAAEHMARYKAGLRPDC